MPRFLLLLGLLAVVQPLFAQAPFDCSEYFSGRNVRFVVATGAGGGFDRSARALARVFSNASGARTQVANITGGSGYLAVKAVSDASSNALTIGLLTRERIVSPLANNAETTLDDFHVLGILSSEGVAWITRSDFEINTDGRTPVASFDRNEAAVRWGLPSMSLGLSLAAVLGHSGSAESSSALSRGDIDIAVYSLSRVRRLLQQGDFRVSLILSNGPHEGFPDIPYLAGQGGLAEQLSAQLASDAREQRMEYASLAARFSVSTRALFISRKIDEESKQCLSESLDSVLASKELAESMRSLGQEFSPMDSAEATRLIETAAQLLEQNRSLLNSALAEVMR